MSNSKLINYTKLTSNCNKPRNNTINKITIHHVAGVATVEGLGATFSGARQVSAQYGIGNDGRIGMYVEEKDRAWTSSNAWNDHQAITIEVSNSAGAPNWPVSEKAFNSLIDLCVDICKRNPNIKQKNGKSGIYFDGTKEGSLTHHQMFAHTGCPGPYLLGKFNEICDLVNARLAGQEDTPAPTPPISKELYRIRKTWQDVNSQKGAFLFLDGAITELKKYEGYNIYNSAGEQVYPKIEKIEIGDIVKIKPGSKTYDGKNPASFVFAGEYSVDELSNDRAVLDKKGIYSPFNIKDLILISKKNENNADKDDTTPEEIGTPIFGESVLIAKQLAAFLLKTNPNPKINCDAVKLAEYFINEGKKLGIRGDIAFAQSINETGYFRYGGDVLQEQNNFCGLGAINGASVGKGAWFETPELGVRAQIQHLFAYATKDNLPSDIIVVDPRFTFVNRGVAKYWENLGGKWAVPGYPSKYKTWDEAWAANATYGQIILKTYDNIIEFAKTYVEKTPEEIAVGDAIDKEIIMNYTHWLNILNGKEEVTTNELLELFQEINRRIK